MKRLKKEWNISLNISFQSWNRNGRIELMELCLLAVRVVPSSQGNPIKQETSLHSLWIPPYLCLRSKYFPLWHAFLMSNVTLAMTQATTRSQNFTRKRRKEKKKTSTVKLKLNIGTLAEKLRSSCSWSVLTSSPRSPVRPGAPSGPWSP